MPPCIRPRERAAIASCAPCEAGYAMVDGMNARDTLKALDLVLKSHPWHGIDSGSDAPRRVTAYIEIVPSDTVKYELDKESGS